MIRLVFTASPKLFSRLIRWCTESDVSHVFIQAPDDLFECDWTIEATFPKVTRRPAEKARHHVVCEYECLFDAKEALRGIQKEMDTWYSIADLPAQFWWIFTKRFFKRWARHPFRSLSGNVCSEFITKWFRASTMLPNTKQFSPEYTTPKDLRIYAETWPKFFKKIG